MPETCERCHWLTDKCEMYKGMLLCDECIEELKEEDKNE